MQEPIFRENVLMKTKQVEYQTREEKIKDGKIKDLLWLNNVNKTWNLRKVLKRPKQNNEKRRNFQKIPDQHPHDTSEPKIKQ